MNKKRNKPAKKVSLEDYELMLSSKRLILNGRRWRKFYELSALIIVFGLVLEVAGISRIIKFGHFEWQLLPFMGIPPMFMIWGTFYKTKELHFVEIAAGPKKDANHDMATRALKKLGWYIQKNQPYFIEAFTGSKISTTWGNEMVSILIDEDKILINCICNVDVVRNQAAFSFGRLTKNTRILSQALEEELHSNV